MDWAKWIAVLAVTSAGIAALLVYLFYFFDFHTRAINKARLKRLHFKQSVVANITERFNNYRDIELKFYLPDPEDAFVLENHQKPVELEDFNFNESDPEDYQEKIWMLRDR